MIIDIPIYIEKQEDRYFLRPLFKEEPYVYHRDLDIGVQLLEKACRRILRGAAKAPHHTDLKEMAFYPTLEERTVSFNFSLRTRYFTFEALVVMFEKLDRKLCFLPCLDNLMFTLQRNESLEARAHDVLLSHFKALAEEEGQAFDPDELREGTKEWVSDISVEIQIPRIIKQKQAQSFRMAALGSETEMNGAEELARVGRNLNRLYPDRLFRARYREREVASLSSSLTRSTASSVLVVGPRQVGKTALVHETVYRRMAARRAEKKVPDCWLLSPGRIISGMSYVGQWEARVHAILAHVKKKRHVLYFDDFLGLYKAGVSSKSGFSVAALIREAIIRKEIRAVVEMTDEQLRLFSEQDRGLKDMFHIIRLAPTTASETLDIGIDAMRTLEMRYMVEFHPEALVRAVSLQNRFNRAAVMPGKLVTFLLGVAKRHKQETVTPQSVLEDFSTAAGLELSYVDNTVSLKREEVRAAIADQVLGQPEAAEALADVVMVGKAGLNDPTRPMASLLFLGPTGVGKTESAKAVTRYLLKDEDRLLRFDLNEYGDHDAVSRLIGTFHRPVGQLTGAIRRQPFSVVLFDEIEKAHPDVFNLLLQVLDDGRLTDAAGEVSDFSQALIIMTSNLGARDRQQQIGYGEGQDDRGTVYRSAAERFFRPEFFNRIDRIVPFRDIAEADLGVIFDTLLKGVLTRSGLTRRKCVLAVTPEVRAHLIAKGYRPDAGARELKRTLERELIRPVAVRLSALSANRVTVAAAVLEQGGVAITVTLLETAPRHEVLAQSGSAAGSAARFSELEARLEAVKDAIRVLMPEERFALDRLTPQAERYLGFSETVVDLEAQLAELELLVSESDAPIPVKVSNIRAKPTKWDRWMLLPSNLELSASHSFKEQLKDLFSTLPKHIGTLEERFTELGFAISTLARRVATETGVSREAVLITRLGIGDNSAAEAVVAKGIDALLAAYEKRELAPGQALYEGAGVGELAKWEQGVHLIEQQDGALEMVAVRVAKVDPDAVVLEPPPAPVSVTGFLSRIGRTLIRIYAADNTICDLRWGIVAEGLDVFLKKNGLEAMRRVPSPDTGEN